MFKTIRPAFFLALLIPFLALADAVIFSGSDVKALKSNIDLNGGAKILSSATDPTSSAVSAPVGSILLNTTNGNAYRKLDSGSSTNWQRVGSGSGTPGNLLTNPDWESVSTGWSESGGTYARTTTAAQVGSGVGAGSWDSNGASQTFTSTAVAIPVGSYARSGVASCLIKCASGTCTHTMQAFDGTNNLISSTITSNAGFQRTSLNFLFPSSGNIQLRLTSVASNEPAIYIDDCYLGLAESFNVSASTQAEIVGVASYATTASCTWTRTNTALGAFGTDADCPAPTVLYNPGPGTISTTDADLPQITVNNLPPGLYEVIASFSTSSGTNGTSTYSLSDGSNTNGRGYGASLSTTGSGATVVGHFNYTDSGTRTFSVYGSHTAGAINIPNDGGNMGLVFSIKKFPSSPEITYRPESLAQSWSGYNTFSSGCSTASTSYADPSACTGMTVTELKNTNFGTVTQLSGPLPGITFTPSRSGSYYICANTTILMSSGAATGSIRIVDGSGSVIAQGVSLLQASTNQTSTASICGIYNVTSIATTSVKLQFSVNTGTIQVQNDNGSGTAAVNWSLVQISQSLPAPVLAGSVTTGSGVSAPFKIASADVGAPSGGACGVSNESVDWINGNATSGATGSCAFTFNTGFFSGTPVCMAIVRSIGYMVGFSAGPSSSGATYGVVDSGGTAQNIAGSIMCFGQ